MEHESREILKDRTFPTRNQEKLLPQGFTSPVLRTYLPGKPQAESSNSVAILKTQFFINIHKKLYYRCW